MDTATKPRRHYNRPRPNTKYSTIGFPLPREHRDQLLRIAAERDVSLSDLMREAVVLYLGVQVAQQVQRRNGAGDGDRS